MNQQRNVNFSRQTGRHLINQAEFTFKWQNNEICMWYSYRRYLNVLRRTPERYTGETLLAEILFFFILYTEISFKTLESFLKLGILVNPLFKDLYTQCRGKSFSPERHLREFFKNASFQIFGNRLMAMAG